MRHLRARNRRWPLSASILIATAPGGATLPTYVPFLKSVMGAGTLGANATTDFNNLSGRNTTVSNDITGPFGESQVVKVGILVANAGNYGGSWNGSPLASGLALGVNLYLRCYYYFPSSFCFGAAGGGDFDGSIKFIRPSYNDTGGPGGSGSRYYGKLGGQTNNACASASVGPTMLGGACDFAAVSNCYAVSPPVIPRDQWVALQWRLKMGDTPATSELQMWVNSTDVGAINMTEQTYPSSHPSGLNTIACGDYYNGGAHQDTYFYMSNVIFTIQDPNTLDPNGKPFISPSTKISDFH